MHDRSLADTRAISPDNSNERLPLGDRSQELAGLITLVLKSNRFGVRALRHPPLGVHGEAKANLRGSNQASPAKDARPWANGLWEC